MIKSLPRDEKSPETPVTGILKNKNRQFTQFGNL
jgi:hypothetical protein